MSTETEEIPLRSLSAAAVRMRRLRQRRRRGARCVRIQLDAAEIDVLIAKGYLDAKDREDLTAVGQAANTFISDAFSCELLI